ncbi:MAG: DUF2059 domain-containing protein [Bacteroidia bacterium]|nr:DUF2059 domain-containing protein [Bacteroidia bacterium]NND52609.1 DUF2059 domain-containing protein [Flavobacteriaceae bacterium]
MKTLILFLGLMGQMILPAQNETLNEGMQNYLLSNGTIEYYSNVVDRMFDFLKNEFEGKNVPESVWTELGQVKSQGLIDITEMIIKAYEGHFNDEELRAMLDFYKTETGENILLKNELSADQIKERDDFNASAIGQKIAVSAESLNNVLQKITQEWSADLYSNVIHQLEEKGYSKGE